MKDAMISDLIGYVDSEIKGSFSQDNLTIKVITQFSQLNA